MIFIQTENEKVVYVHTDPLHPEMGLGTDEKTLRSIGYLVEELPKVKETTTSKQELYYDGKEFRVVEVPKKANIEDKVESLEQRVLPKTEIFEKLSMDTDIEVYREAKRDALKEQCTAAIHAGFKSASLEKEFGFNEHDQSNFTQQLLLIVASGGQYTNPIAWKSLDGAVNTLTTEQFNTLVQEATIHKVSQQQRYWEIEVKLNQASTQEAIRQVGW